MKKIIFFVVLCFAALKGLAQTDTIFWFSAPAVYQGHADRPIFLRFSNPDPINPVSIEITMPALGGADPIKQTVNLTGGGTQSIDLTYLIDQIELNAQGGIENKGIKLQSTNSQKFTAYYENLGAGVNAEIMALKGQNAFGYKFFTPFQNWLRSEYFGTPLPPSIDIVATQTGTTNVTIVPTQPVKIGNVSYAAGSTITKALTQGQTLSIVAAGNLGPQHPSGTMVTADQKIVVNTKDDSVLRRNIDKNQDNYDLIMDQIIPTDVIGKEYILVRSELRGPQFGNQDVGVIVATEDGTQVTIDAGDHQKTITLNKGQTDTVQVSSSSAYFKSTKNIYVMQLSGYDFELSGPVLPSIICTGSNSVTFVRSTNKIFFLNMLFPTGAENDFKIHINPNATKPFPLQDVEEVPGTNGEWSEVHLQLTLSDIPANTAATISNDNFKFHLGFIDADASNTSRYGYFSNFNKYKLAIPQPSQLCKGTPVTLHAGPGFDNYYWRKDDPAPVTDISNGTSDSITVSTDGTYYIQATQGLNCVVDTTIKIKFNTPVTINFKKDTAICSTDAYTLSVADAPGQSYKWLYRPDKNSGNYSDVVPVNTTNIERPAITGEYKIELTSANGCVSKDSIYVKVSHPEEISYTINSPAPVCSGVDTVIGPTSPAALSYKYNWDVPPIGPQGLTSYAIQNPHTGILINNSLQDSIVIYPFMVKDTATGCIKKDTVKVYVHPAPALTLHDTSGCLSNNLFIRATTKLTSGVIDWSPASYFTNSSSNISSTNTSNQLALTSAGVYSITAKYTSGGGCPGIATSKVVAYGPTVDVQDVSTCENSPIDLAAITDSAGGTITWSPAFKLNTASGRNVTFSGASSGRYGYEITFNDKHGCPAKDSAYVNITSTLVADAGPLTLEKCTNSSQFQLDGSNSSQGAGISYKWTSLPATTITNANDLNPKVQPTVTTKFYLQVLSGKCSAMDSITINVNTLPIVTAGIDTNVCLNQMARLKAQANTNGSYSWTPTIGVDNPSSANTFIDSVKATNSYTVTFTDANNCVATAQTLVTMKDLPVITSNDAQICNGGTAVLQASIPADPNAQYTWMPGGKSGASYSVNPVATTTYTVTAKDLSTGCSNSKPVLVTVNNFAQLKVTGKTNICPGESTTLTASSTLNNPTYTWTPGGNTASITIGPLTSPQTYNLKVSGSGCDKDTTIKVTINEKPIITVNPDPSCLGQTLTLTASPADPSYTWSNGQTGWVKTGASITDIPTKPGSITYNVQASNVSCTAGIGTITVTVNPKPDFAFSNKDVKVCFAEIGAYPILSPITDPNYTYQWQPDGQTKDSIHVTKSGSYTLIVTNQFGCKATDMVKIEESCDVDLFVPKAFTPNGDGHNDSLAVFYYFVKDFEIVIFNRWGEIVYKANEKTTGMNTNNKGQNVWDGKYKEADSPIETYPYIIKYNSLIPDDPKNPRTKRGAVTIIR